MSKKRKEKALGVFKGSFETYNRYSVVNDEEQKKKILGVLIDSFSSNLVGESQNFFKRGL